MFFELVAVVPPKEICLVGAEGLVNYLLMEAAAAPISLYPPVEAVDVLYDYTPTFGSGLFYAAVDGLDEEFSKAALVFLVKALLTVSTRVVYFVIYFTKVYFSFFSS